ncbi:patatin-like phospholipase family protein [Schaalia suimastitidis]|uniref:patatin-like phospholipase family protein n=1 Tax=Schaalia suimastitidis TaxID=121163 RepID=UPI00040068AE|nr:patatin family protein [Schaalia suimastitidis]
MGADKVKGAKSTQQSDMGKVAMTDSNTGEHVIDDVAIVFEGGGMRGAHTAGVVTTLIEEGIVFPHVSGVSAGATHSLNYVSRDAWRARAAFVDIAADPRCGGMASFLRGEGMFNVEFLYEQIPQPDGELPFDMEAFEANPAQVQVATFNATRGQTEWLTRKDMATLQAVCQAVRASSTLPILMPPLQVEGETYFDGALGDNGGIALDAAMRAGYKKYVVVLTRPRDYVKGGLRPALDIALRAKFKDFPSVYEGVLRRPARYNTARRKVFELEEQGRAFVFAPEVTTASSTEMNVDRLDAAYHMGLAQFQRELPAFKAFLGL